MVLPANQAPDPILLMCPSGSEALANAVKASLRTRGEAAEVHAGIEEPDTLGESLVGHHARLWVILRWRGHGELAERRLRFHLESNGVHPGSICTLRLDGTPPGTVADQIQAELLREEPDLEDQVTQRVSDEVIAELMQEAEESQAGASRSATKLGIPPPAGAVVPGAGPPPPAPARAAPPQAPAATPVAVRSPAAADDDLLVEPTGFGNPQWRRWGIAGASLLGLVVIALAFAFSGDDEAPTEVAAAAQEAAPVEAQPEAPAPAPEPMPAAQAAPVDAPPPAEPAKEPAPSEPPADEAPEAADVIPIEDDGQATVAEDEVINAGLRRRKFRALDALLVTYVAMKRRNYAQAEQYCAELEVAGVVGWRLPDVGEIVTLSRARMLPRRTYWSRTAGDTSGARRLAWNAKRRRIYPLSVKWRNGRTVCVRPR